MDVQKELTDLAYNKSGNKELAIFFDGYGQWSIALGNTCESVMLGEAPGEFEVEGDTLEDAINNLKELV